jgi:hypothetical protein
MYFRPYVKGYFGYTNVYLDKTKKVTIPRTAFIEDDFTMIQHQFYLNLRINPGKGIELMPAFHYIALDYKTVFPEYSRKSGKYSFPKKKIRLRNYIGYLSVSKDFDLVKAGIFGSISNLNDVDQYQLGINFTAYPLGNTDFYSVSTLLGHHNDGSTTLVFDQLFGARLVNNLWLEISATFGELRNYHEKGGSVVYNIADQINFKGCGKLIWNLNPAVKLTLVYLYLSREDNYVNYVFDHYENARPVFRPEYHSYEYQNHIILAGVVWKF